MDWLEEVRENIKKKRQILFTPESAILEKLALMLDAQHRKAVVLWAFEMSNSMVQTLAAHYLDDSRPKDALNAAEQWAFGQIKMPEARKKIIACHAMAKDIQDPVDKLLCHAIGQGVSSVHTQRHAISLPMYELTSVVHYCGIDHCQAMVEARVLKYENALTYWMANYEYYNPWPDFKWADFMNK